MRRLELVGERFGMLEVLEYLGKSKWKCRCDCGNIIEVSTSHLRSGHTTSCGCRHKKPVEDLSGKRFGMLIAIDYYRKDNRTYWKCKCDCGNYTDVQAYSLKSGKTKSCGCIKSFEEDSIYYYIKSIYCFNIIRSDRTVLNGKEIDIYLPDVKVGIEYNGSAFHSSNLGAFGAHKDKYYHQNKFLQAKKNGVNLITVFDKYYFDNKKYYDDLLYSNIYLDRTMKFNSDIVVINNNDGNVDLSSRGYKLVEITEPEMFKHKGFEVYDCGKSVWEKI